MWLDGLSAPCKEGATIVQAGNPSDNNAKLIIIIVIVAIDITIILVDLSYTTLSLPTSNIRIYKDFWSIRGADSVSQDLVQSYCSWRLQCNARKRYEPKKEFNPGHLDLDGSEPPAEHAVSPGPRIILHPLQPFLCPDSAFMASFLTAIRPGFTTPHGNGGRHIVRTHLPGLDTTDHLPLNRYTLL